MRPRTGEPATVWTGVAAIGVLAGSALAAQPPPVAESSAKLTVVTQARPTTCVVGQTVELSVGVVGEAERPKVEPFHVDGADLFFVRNEQVPLSAGGIGDVVWEKNLFRFRYRIVPRRAGRLGIPRVVARLGQRSGAADPLRLVVNEVPRAGRPTAFLGGVGRFEVDARAAPLSVRTGQVLEYRITVTGPGARGVNTPPTVDRLARLPLGLQVERLPDVTMPDPPSHTFVYHLRPTRPGEATLPPVSVAAYDPATGLFPTKVSPGIAVRVTDVPAFDPSRLAFRPAPVPLARRWAVPSGRSMAVLAAATALAAAGMVIGIVRRRHSTRLAVRRLGRRLDARLRRAATDPEHARLLAEGLTDFLALTTGRAPGALTPVEAAAGVGAATGRNDLARRAAELVTRCDQVLFGPGSTGQLRSAGPPGDEGRELLAGLIRAHLVAARRRESGRTSGDDGIREAGKHDERQSTPPGLSGGPS